MKKLTVITVTLLALYSCNSASSAADEAKLALQKENIAVVEKYIQAVEARDTKTMLELLSDNYKGYGPSFTDSIDKKGVAENWTYLTENVYEKFDYQRTVNVAATVTDGPNPGEFVSDWANLKIYFKDGRGPVDLNVNAVYRVENGKITLTRTFYNEADVLRQLGYEFYPKELN